MISYKKNLLASVFLCLFSIVSGTSYYVSSTGNDAANGISESTAWKSISKVNSAFSTFKSGDKILFRKGDTFYGTLTVSVPGASGNPLTIGAYGTGNNPIISGLSTLTEWTNYGGGIWYKAVSTQSTPNILLLDGVNTPLGRTPNMPSPHTWPNGLPNVDAGTSTSINDAALASSPNLVGGEVVMFVSVWIVTRCTITSHSGSTISYGSTPYPVNAGNSYFIQNHISTLNVFGEWCYSGGNIYMYFGSDNPSSHTIKVSSLNNIITTSNNYVTFDGLTIEGGNVSNINLNGCNNVTIKNCTIQNGGNTGINGLNGTSTTNNILITGNTINDNNNFAINFGNNNGLQITSNTTISYNSINRSGYILGMGGSGNTDYSAIICLGDYNTITRNSIEYSGYDGISITGKETQVTFNYITYPVLNKKDGGGIYSYRDYNVGNKNITNNIVLHCPTQRYGWYETFESEITANGIYMDGACYQNISNNTIAFVEGKGIFVNSNHNHTIENNTIFDCSRSIYVMSEHDAGLARNHVIRYNTIVANSSTSNQEILRLVTLGEESDISQFGVIDYNYYASPMRSDDYINRWYKAWNWTPADTYSKNINLEELKNYGYDKNSIISTRAADANKVRFEYNASSTNKSITLDAGYIDAKGTKYSGVLTLLPYTSFILMVDPNPSAAPSSPVYSSSAIENATPAILELTYNTTLANKIPVATAFSVQVNSVARAVNSVTISGTKVLLSLASPVVNGNVVTVAYSKPASNPLQTFAGGQAANLSAQSVTNRVSSVPVVPGTPVVNPVYVSSTVENEAPSKIVLVYNMALSNVLPAVSAFAVRVNSVSRSVSSLVISGSSVILTLASELIFNDVVTVAYTKPTTNALQSVTGLQPATMSAQTVTNKVSSVGPVYVSSSIEKSTPNILEINYNEILDNTVPTPAAFIVMVNGINSTITTVSVSGKKVLLTLANPVVYGDIITVSYIKPATNPLKKSTGEAAGSFSSPQRVTNNIIKKSNMYVFPNPAREYINITIKEPSKDKQIIRIFDFSGKLCLETILDPLANTIRIPISLNSGVYIVQVILGSITSFTQKIIVTD